MASSPKAPLRHRPYKPRQSKRRPITTEAEFVAAHMAAYKQLWNYHVDHRAGSIHLSSAEFDRIAPGDAPFLYAANATARIAYVKIAARHITAKLGALWESAPLAFVTLIEERFTVGLKTTEKFKVKRLQRWAKRRLPGCSFIGIVEAALYTNSVINAGMDRSVSWHVHLLVWGISQERLERLIAKMNRRYSTRVPGVAPGHAIPLKREAVAARVYYSFKGPINAYRIWASKEEVVDPRTGEITKQQTGEFNQAKDPLRPGDQARMARVLEDHTIDRLAFAAGEGETVLAAINREALAPYARMKRQSSSDRRLPTSVQMYRPPPVRPKVGALRPPASSPRPFRSPSPLAAMRKPVAPACSAAASKSKLSTRPATSLSNRLRSRR